MAPRELDDADRALVQKVETCFQNAKADHDAFMRKAEGWYGLYRGYTDFRSRAGKVDARDRDEVIHEAQKQWGAELFIPFCYSTVETIVPRMLANNPRMIVVPRDEEAYGRVKNMKLVIDAQQKQIDYQTILQTIAKDGLIYSIGVGKTRWCREERLQTKLEPSLADPYSYTETAPQQAVIFDDAVAERVDPFDFINDPNGDSMQTVEWVIHRTWRSPAYVTRCVSQGHFRAQENDPACTWTLEDLLSSVSPTKRSTVMNQRLAAEGYPSTEATRQDRLHEVWEWHDGETVITVLNGSYPVQHGANPSGSAKMPFQTYRGTVIGGRFQGISEVEPIQHLQYEINTLRSQRRDAATLALMRTFAYNETAIDPDDLVFGPGLAIPVNGDPRDFLFPIPVPDLPASSYQEENRIVDDIQRTSGISDPVTGGDVGASETATGVQLVQAAATMRIQNKTRLLENQVIVPQGYEFVALNQRRILKERFYAIPSAPDPNNPEIPAWKYLKVGPAELMGRMAIEVEGGSTAPENVPQQRQDAQMFVQLSQDQRLEGTKLLLRALQLMGIDQPEGYLAPTMPQIPAELVQGFLASVGVPPQQFVAYLDQAQAAQAQAQNGNAAPQEAPA